MLSIMLASASLSAGTPATDFGVRAVGLPPAMARGIEGAVAHVINSGGIGSLSGAARIGAEFGRVTSTWRSVEHNRAVGGVRDSYHLLGRAIDIVPRPGVSHAMIAEAYRRAGYRLVESLNEGDHSHFAFSFNGGMDAPSLRPVQKEAAFHPGKIDTGSLTGWKIVYAPGAR